MGSEIWVENRPESRFQRLEISAPDEVIVEALVVNNPLHLVHILVNIHIYLLHL